jgi:hypothetical protein
MSGIEEFYKGLLTTADWLGVGNDMCDGDDTRLRHSVGCGTMENGIRAIDVLVRRGMRSQDFCLLLTKDSIVLVREKGRDEIHPGAFGYASVHIREHDHPSYENIDKVEHDMKNLVIPYDRLRKIQLRQGFSSSTMRREYIILLTYLDASMKERKMSAVLTSPPQQKGRGTGYWLSRAMANEYAREVRRLLAEALPASCVFVASE